MQFLLEAELNKRTSRKAIKIGRISLRTPLLKREAKKRKMEKKTYNSGRSLVATDPATDPPLCSLYKADWTGCLVLYKVWSNVLDGR